jgi:hypothetical protein
VVGRITGMVDCRWKEGTADRGQAAECRTLPSPLIRLGDKFALASGLMEITYDTGAKVILQGPVIYEVDSINGGFLSVGTLTARVEKRAEGGGRMAEEVAGGPWSVAGKSEIKNLKSEMVDSPPFALRLPSSSNPQSLIPNPSLSTIHYPLFTIKTPTATVTDLGTEFGVDVDQTGNTTSHVFCGFVRVQAVADGDKAQDDSQLLHENQSARVEKRGNHRTIVVISSAKPVGFVREIPKPENKPAVKTLDLVDVVAGGDGFSGRRAQGIDPSNGQILGAVPSDPKRVNTKGDYTYHRVPGLPLVDGVFIPDGSRGPVQVDSAGHRFDGFEATANMSVAWIWADAAIPVIPPGTGNLRIQPGSFAGHGLISLHANKGITFDLDAIRKANPGFKLVRFCSVAGNIETQTAEGKYFYADIRVLVDGEQRFSRRQINNTHGAFAVNIPLQETDRFLTLVATDGKDGISYDWIRFGDPRLELIPVARTVK